MGGVGPPHGEPSLPHSTSGDSARWSMGMSWPRDMAMARIIWSSSDMLRSWRGGGGGSGEGGEGLWGIFGSPQPPPRMAEPPPYPHHSPHEGWGVGEEVLGGLLHGVGVEQSLHGVLPREAHVHQLQGGGANRGLGGQIGGRGGK